MKYLLWLFFPLALFSDNQVRISLNCTATVNADGTDPKFSMVFSRTLLDQPNPPANILLTSTPLVTYNLTDLQNRSFIDIPFTLRAIPNPGSLNGYTVAVNMLTQVITLDVQSTLFEKFRLFQLTGYRSTILNAEFPGMTIWFQRVNTETFTTGVQISPSLTTDNAIVSNSASPESITITLRFSTANLIAIESGVYQIQLLVGMDPYTATPSQRATTAVEVVTQINALQAYINQINGYLTNNNSVYTLTTAQSAILHHNKNLLQKQLVDIVRANASS
jgi:hypothetical protein